MDTSSKALYIKVFQSTMVDLDGDAESFIHVALDSYDLRDVPFVTVVTVGSDTLPYRFEFLMVNKAHDVFRYDDLQLTCHLQSERVLSHFNDIAAVSRVGLNGDIGFFPRAPKIVTTDAPVTAEFVIILLLYLWRYTSVMEEWRDELIGPGCAIFGNRLRSFDTAVIWEYDMALGRIVAA